jgi:serine/threonine protein phosphatase PrpC
MIISRPRSAATRDMAAAPSSSSSSIIGGGGGPPVSLEAATNGGSMVIPVGSLSGGGGAAGGGGVGGGFGGAGGWEPGAPILRPENTSRTEVLFVPLPPPSASPAEGGGGGGGGSSGSSSSGSGEGPATTGAAATATASSSATHYLRLSYAANSKQGRSPRPPAKPNQDSFLVAPSLGGDPSLALFAVFDGHGPRGEDASHFARTHLPDACARQPSFPRAPFEAFASSFEALHRRFVGAASAQRTGVDTSVSGTTAVAVLFRGGQWVCGNVGDSRAMLAARSPTGGLVAKALSSDHKPQRPDERARIGRTAAKILSERQLGIEGGDPDKWYVCRVQNGAIRYGVLFTRSIGDADAHANLGLVATPELRKGAVEGSRDRFIVLASDGVWDYLGEDSVARIVAQSTGMPLSAAAAGGPERLAEADLRASNRAQEAADALVAAAEARWEAEGDRRRDDITAVVILMRVVTREEKEREEAKGAGLQGVAEGAEGEEEGEEGGRAAVVFAELEEGGGVEVREDVVVVGGAGAGAAVVAAQSSTAAAVLVEGAAAVDAGRGPGAQQVEEGGGGVAGPEDVCLSEVAGGEGDGDGSSAAAAAED